MPTVAIHTFGCKLNFAESGSLEMAFAAAGWTVVPSGEAADAVVINTCSVTEEAERKCRQAVRRARAGSPDTIVAVTGCYAQLRPDDLGRLDGVDVVVGNRNKAALPRLLAEATRPERTQIDVSCMNQAPFEHAAARGSRTRGFLKVQDGCDYSCSFCTIPLARGASRSPSIGELVDRARGLARDGASEIVLTGVNIGLYGLDSGSTFLSLLQALDQVADVPRFRISSIEPNLLTDDVVAFVAGSRAFQPHFHVPLQSGDDRVLGAMRRRYRREVFADRVRAIRDHVPDASIGADVIVGFPTETPDAFEETARFVAGLELSYLHVFTYSERPGTVAAGLGSGVDRAERSRRNRVLTGLGERLHRSFAARFVGRERPVLWEAPEPDGSTTGLTDNFLRVRSAAGGPARGTITSVRLDRVADDGIVDTDEYTLAVLS